jgi:hypothetical protein
MEQVTIPACIEHGGFRSLTVNLPWHCIYCGEERGEPFLGFSFDGSRRLSVTLWKNPCGHVETYAAIREWLAFQKELGAVD